MSIVVCSASDIVTAEHYLLESLGRLSGERISVYLVSASTAGRDRGNAVGILYSRCKDELHDYQDE